MQRTEGGAYRRVATLELRCLVSDLDDVEWLADDKPRYAWWSVSALNIAIREASRVWWNIAYLL